MIALALVSALSALPSRAAPDPAAEIAAFQALAAPGVLAPREATGSPPPPSGALYSARAGLPAAEALRRAQREVVQELVRRLAGSDSGVTAAALWLTTTQLQLQATPGRFYLSIRVPLP